MIQDLPINGRRVDSFVLLTPGVTNDSYFGLLTFRGVAGGNAFLVDGNDTTEQFFNENAGRTRIASQISQDAVQEFQVVSSNSSAEFGRAVGGVVNTVTRTGSNDLHGTAYWFFRNRTLDARDRYATINPDEVRNQAGASIGGALIKNKLFYFFNGDFTRRNFPMVSSISRAGVIDPNTESFVGCGAPATPAQCAAINTILPRYFGLIPRQANQDLGFAPPRLAAIGTQHLQRKFELLALRIAQRHPDEYFLNHRARPSEAMATIPFACATGELRWTAVPKPNWVNELRFGWATDRQADTFNPRHVRPGARIHRPHGCGPDRFG